MSVKGSSGKPTPGEYYNSEGKAQSTSMTANFGLGNEAAAFNFAKELEVKASKALTTSPAPEIEFDAEKGWHGQSTGSAEIEVAVGSRVICEKETFEGASPTSGFATASDLAPSYSGCQFELEEGGKTTKTNATIEACGFEYELLKGEEASRDDFKSGFDISKCTGGKSGESRSPTAKWKRAKRAW
jgi:hypothetical protein